MILRVLKSATTDNCVQANRAQQNIKAHYDPHQQYTTVYLDADIVTLGIVATYLFKEFNERKKEIPADLMRQLDNVILDTLNHTEGERGQA